MKEKKERAIFYNIATFLTTQLMGRLVFIKTEYPFMFVFDDDE